MKKRVLALMLGAILALSLCACGSDTSDTTTGTDTTGETQDTQQEEDQAEAAEQVLVDQDGIKITFTGVEDSVFGKDIKLKIENTSDVDVVVQNDSTSANGTMMSGATMSAEVGAGKNANTSITLFSTELEEAGITDITEIETGFHTVDPSTFMTITEFESVTITVG